MQKEIERIKVFFSEKEGEEKISFLGREARTVPLSVFGRVHVRLRVYC